MKASKAERDLEHMVAFWFTLPSLLPIIRDAVTAERVAPGYGAEAVMFRRLNSMVNALDAEAARA